MKINHFTTGFEDSVIPKAIFPTSIVELKRTERGNRIFVEWQSLLELRKIECTINKNFVIPLKKLTSRLYVSELDIAEVPIDRVNSYEVKINYREALVIPGVDDGHREKIVEGKFEVHY